ncbi:MAG: di-heme-cytochrome C peroxidase [Gammaproteobacteria bacterium]|nr:di-heme-cytochrome C peroxidase [Gammaproteobacteria bacterium]
MSVALRTVILFALIFMSGCTYVSQGVSAGADRAAVAVENDEFGDSAKNVVYLDQNWNRWDSLWFYNTTQGSDFLPYDIFINLEQANALALFRDQAHISKFRYLPQQPSWDNPDGLPVGFVKDDYEGNAYVGFTCAACHTTQINYKGTGIRIDGGPTLADMDSMLLALEQAMQATLQNPEKLTRIATKMGRDNANATTHIQQALTELQTYNKANVPTNGKQVVHYGYGRLDAFGRIYNRVLAHLTPGQPNFNPPNAPVSVPFLWDTPQHDFVQWNGVADNNDGSATGFLGPLGRNTGEVLGVFASFSLEKQNGHLGYKSSVDKRNLIRLEQHLASLESPQWPETVLPAINKELAGLGKDVYKQYRCAQCHSGGELFSRNASDRQLVAQFASVNLVGTDQQMSDNALNYQGATGLFKGEPMDFGSDHKFADTTHVVFALQKAAKGVIIARDPDKSWLRARLEWLYDLVIALFDNPVKKTERHVDFEINSNFPTNLNAYKARPLNGIWATAPYLHNGSVPNLYELFLPSCTDKEVAAGKKCRSNRFTVGSREFDPQHVGLTTQEPEKYPGLFVFDTHLPGNSNVGHEYEMGRTPIIKLDNHGNPVRKADGSFVLERLPPITEDQRVALVEYLKTL